MTRDTRDGWVSTRHLQYLVSRGDAAGEDMDRLLLGGGLDRARLADPEGRLPLAAVETMLQAAAGDPLLALRLSAEVRPATLGALGLIFQACGTVADVLETAARFSGLLSNIGHTSLAHAPGRVELRWECLAGSDAFRAFAADYVLGSFAAIARLLLPGIERQVLAVEVPHPAPPHGEQVKAWFDAFGAPVHFDRPHAALALAAGALSMRLPHGDALLRDVLERHAHDALARRRTQTTLAGDAQRLLGALLRDGLPGRDAVAAQLGMSGRSLHRRLQEEGTSFRELLDQARLALARERLAGDDSLADIAGQLGFSSPQVFQRWFRQQTGTTPGECRRAAGALPQVPQKVR
jgi:AraC-like DNA-binding protein